MISPLEDGIDHVRGPEGATLIVEYGDYECPYSRQAFRAIERVEGELGRAVRFAFRHFPLTRSTRTRSRRPARRRPRRSRTGSGRCTTCCFTASTALEVEDLRRYATELELDIAAFDRDRVSEAVARPDRP